VEAESGVAEHRSGWPPDRIAGLGSDGTRAQRQEKRQADRVRRASPQSRKCHVLRLRDG